MTIAFILDFILNLLTACAFIIFAGCTSVFLSGLIVSAIHRRIHGR